MSAPGNIAAQQQSGGNGMSADPLLTNQQIALLCDIGEFKMLDLTVERKRDLEHLISVGYVAPTEGDAKSAFRLTLEAHNFLSMRGATLNEA